MITDKTAKALQIIRDNPNLTANWFAQKMWPDSKGHTRSYNTGNGATSGKGMWLAAGSYLAKLVKKKLVSRWNGFQITSEGRKALEEWESHNKNDHAGNN